MKVLSIISQKGGVGKTTIATALAVAAEADGYRTAIFDLDDQATACFWADVREADTPPVRDMKPVRLASNIEIMRKAKCDLLIIDCPPVAKDVALDAAMPADFVLIPTKAEVFDIMSMTKTVELLRHFQKPSAVLLNMCAPSGPEVPAARAAVEKLGAVLCPFELGYRKDFSRAQQQGLTAQEYNPHGTAAEELANIYKYTCIQLYGEKRHAKAKKKSYASRA